MEAYNASDVEKKWQDKWKESEQYKTDTKERRRKKYYNLVMFPYPSGDKLHIGHWYNFGPSDSHGRYMRMQGYNVMQPMGFDSFGLPAENYAIKTGVHPKESIATNCEYMRKQLSAMGAMWDWDKEVVTSSKEYYKWTQWVFLKLYEKDLAYKSEAPVNWCDSCKTVLANEQVENGKCERCKNDVVKKNLNQWFLRISDYAEKLLEYDGLDWPEKTILMQKNWIGKSKGCNVAWKLKGNEDFKLETFTTTVDTIYGVTFVVISPEHPELDLIVDKNHKKSVDEYIKKAAKKSDIERMDTSKGKTGVDTGAKLIHPFTGEEIPLWISDYVLMNYGTGVVMGVPAHDQRDMDFAKQYKFKIVQSIENEDGESFVYDDVDKYNVKGKLVDSEGFTGMDILEAREKIIDKLEGTGDGNETIQFKLRDWLISRQRYWGAPIPVVYDPEGNAHAIPEEHLPWTLPEDVDFNPDGTAPLARSKELVKRTEEIFGKGWKPEVDTMDTFMCSSWYFLRYPDNKNEKKAFDEKIINKWLPVDMYIGGPEHACMHLLYARFIHRALHEMGYIKSKEPFKRLIHQGMVTKDGAKMSKSKGNVVSPDEFVEKYGSDVFRMYLMFMGPFTEGGDWNDKGITGIARFVERFWKLINQSEQKVNSLNSLKRRLHKLIKKITEDIESFQYNTAIASMMEFVNFALKNGIDERSKKKIVQLMAPMAPHLAEECWSVLGEKYSIFDSVWPKYDKKLVVDVTVTIGVQVNGRVRGEVEISPSAGQEEAMEKARALDNVKRHLAKGEVTKEIYVPGRIIGFVVK